MSRLKNISRGFPPKHPLVSGSIKIHPELQGELFFDNDSPTSLHLNSEDYHRHLQHMDRRGMMGYFPVSRQYKTFPRPILMRRSQLTPENIGIVRSWSVAVHRLLLICNECCLVLSLVGRLIYSCPEQICKWAGREECGTTDWSQVLERVGRQTETAVRPVHIPSTQEHSQEEQQLQVDGGQSDPLLLLHLLRLHLAVAVQAVQDVGRVPQEKTELQQLLQRGDSDHPKVRTLLKFWKQFSVILLGLGEFDRETGGYFNQ